MPKIDLLPCPYCGSPAKLCSSKANAAGTRFVFWVHCDFRGDLNCDVIPITPKFDTAEQAVKAWNTRASGKTFRCGLYRQGRRESSTM